MTKISKWIMGMSAATMALIGMVATKAVHAAADTDLAVGFASTTAIFTDNKSAIIVWFVGIFTVLIVIGLALRALFFARRQANGIFGGGRKGRR